jgi:hypothetical protein
MPHHADGPKLGSQNFFFVPQALRAEVICTATNTGTAIAVSSCFQRNRSRAARRKEKRKRG